ncbi:MAG: hypothetical protein QM722_00495 [Piscinibacter sp.]
MGDLRVTFTDAELASIRQAAEVLGLTPEDFVRLVQPRARAAARAIAKRGGSRGGRPFDPFRARRRLKETLRPTCCASFEMAVDPLVIDASVALKWYLREDGSDAALRLLSAERP